MARRLQVCPHCRGKKICQVSGGRSCKDCLAAAGMGRKSWAAVRCSFCGGSGFVREEEPGPPEKEEDAQAPTPEDKSED